jgi:hypothetical protein
MSAGAKQNGVEPLAKTPAPSSGSGFHAQLEGAVLWDLVQMECFARSHLVVEVAGEGGSGYLYFDAGRVVHATTERNRGVPAALEILGWTRGTFQPSNRSWPTGGPTIDVTPESLLLHAAQRRDEESGSNLVAFPGRGIEAASQITPDDGVELMEIEEGLEMDDEDVTRPGGEAKKMIRSPNIESAPASQVMSARAEASSDFPIMLRLSAAGAIVRNKGGTEDLAEAASYAHRLVQLAGELLGLEEFVALECVFDEGRALVFTEGQGDVVVLRPRPDLNLQPLRERLGL